MFIVKLYYRNVMGQYYIFRNYTRKEAANVGNFYGGWAFYVKLFGWHQDDEVTAYGDNGGVMHMNPKAPEDMNEMDSEEVWAMCVFAAKKCGMTPQDFWSEFLRDGGLNTDEDFKNWKQVDHPSLSILNMQTSH